MPADEGWIKVLQVDSAGLLEGVPQTTMRKHMLAAITISLLLHLHIRCKPNIYRIIMLHHEYVIPHA